MIETLFNIAFPLTVAAAGVSVTLFAVASNACLVAQREAIKAQVSSALSKLKMVKTHDIDCELLVTNLRQEKVDVVTIPDMVQQLRHHRVYLSAGILLAFALLVVVLLLEFMIGTSTLPNSTHQASLVLCWLDVMVVVTYSAGSVVAFQRTATWSDFWNTVYPRSW